MGPAVSNCPSRSPPLYTETGHVAGSACAPAAAGCGTQPLSPARSGSDCSCPRLEFPHGMTVGSPPTPAAVPFLCHSPTPHPFFQHWVVPSAAQRRIPFFEMSKSGVWVLSEHFAALSSLKCLSNFLQVVFCSKGIFGLLTKMLSWTRDAHRTKQLGPTGIRNCDIQDGM